MTTGNQHAPVAVDLSNLPSGESFTAIDAGETHACALTNSGKAFCWGSDTNGELGNGATSGIQEIPVAVDMSTVTNGESFQDISLGYLSSCALSNSGTVYCWGSDNRGKLGNGAPGADQLTPVSVDVTNLASGESFVQIGIGHSHGCALTNSSTAYCWGWNDTGQLGTGDTLSELAPFEVTSPF